MCHKGKSSSENSIHLIQGIHEEYQGFPIHICVIKVSVLVRLQFTFLKRKGSGSVGCLTRDRGAAG